ncbi:conjugal transfer relaxosome protein TraY [Salmonella enterica]|nr:conjugal transfer relaxosome protein TraY [Salmonella enterica]
MLIKARHFWRVFFCCFPCNHTFISRVSRGEFVRRRNAREGISRTVSVYLDEDTNNRLIRAKDRSGRSKTIEVQIRLRDHLKRYPDFYNEEIFREVIEETESTFKEI